MIKFSQIINENQDFEDIEDSLLGIYDLFGEPRVVRTNVDKSKTNQMAYSLRWDMGFSMQEYNGIEVLSKTAQLLSILSDIKSTQNRLRSYEINFKISGQLLFIRLVPLADETDARADYNFLIGQNGREVQFKYSEILRFFRDRNCKIKNILVDDNEYSQTSTLVIVTDADGSTKSEFRQIVMGELESKNVDRDIDVGIAGTSIEIYPQDEKTYVVIDGEHD